jgi:ATP-dependent helicase/nuclease subunit B
VARPIAFGRVGYRVTDDILQRVGAVLQSIVEGIESGTFPHHPSTTSVTNPWVECPYCDPDNLGVTELRRSLERKAGDPALHRYLVLAEEEAGSEG